MNLNTMSNGDLVNYFDDCCTEYYSILHNDPTHEQILKISGEYRAIKAELLRRLNGKEYKNWGEVPQPTNWGEGVPSFPIGIN